MPGSTPLQDSVLQWLLEEDNPSVRYFTLRDILEFPKNDPQVLEAKSAIMTSGPVPKILSRQKPEGHWGKPEDFYMRSKYKGTVWSFILLADLGADGKDQRIARTVEFLLQTAQDPQSGGFAYQSAPEGGGDHDSVIPCLSGNMVWAMLQLGFGEDTQVQQGVEYLASSLRCDDGESKPPKTWPYTVKEGCWGKHTCMMTVVKTLKALAEIPAEKRSPSVQKAIDEGTEFILIHHLYKKSHNLTKVAKASWMQPGFPWMWQTDVLEMLLLLRQLDIYDPRMEDALELMRSKQDPEGKWLLEHSYNWMLPAKIEQKDQPSKWVTLNTLRVLKWVNQKNIVSN